MKIKNSPPPGKRGWAQSRREERNGSDASSVSTSNCTKIYKRRRTIGEVHDEIFVVHLEECKKTIWLKIASLEQATKAGARIVEVVDKGSGKVYRAYISLIFAWGRRDKRGNIGLPCGDWSLEDVPLYEQLRLWE